MAIRSKRSIVIDQFISTRTEQDSPWSLRITVLDDKVRFDLFWGDAETPASFAIEDFDKFFALLGLTKI